MVDWAQKHQLTNSSCLRSLLPWKQQPHRCSTVRTFLLLNMQHDVLQTTTTPQCSRSVRTFHWCHVDIVGRWQAKNRTKSTLQFYPAALKNVHFVDTVHFCVGAVFSKVSKSCFAPGYERKPNVLLCTHVEFAWLWRLFRFKDRLASCDPRFVVVVVRNVDVGEM